MRAMMVGCIHFIAQQLLLLLLLLSCVVLDRLWLACCQVSSFLVPSSISVFVAVADCGRRYFSDSPRTTADLFSIDDGLLLSCIRSLLILLSTNAEMKW